MSKRKTLRALWRHIPTAIRKPLVLVTGMLFMVAAALTGWLPGPGGIPLFLVGIAILATEFVWAEKIRDYVLGLIKRLGRWLRRNPLLGAVSLLLGAVGFTAAAYLIYRRVHP